MTDDEESSETESSVGEPELADYYSPTTDSWSDEEVGEDELHQIATKAVSTGRTMRTRRDGSPVPPEKFVVVKRLVIFAISKYNNNLC